MVWGGVAPACALRCALGSPPSSGVASKAYGLAIGAGRQLNFTPYSVYLANSFNGFSLFRELITAFNGAPFPSKTSITRGPPGIVIAVSSDPILPHR